MSQQTVVYDGRDLSGLAGGNCTINASSGKACIAVGASACVVTNSEVAANDIILLSVPSIDSDAPLLKVVAAAGSFTVTCCAEASGSATAANAKYPFNFVVVKMAL